MTWSISTTVASPSPSLAHSHGTSFPHRTDPSPSLALRDGVPSLAFGTPGGDQQDAWQLCFWLAHPVGGANLQAAPVKVPLGNGFPQVVVAGW
jgi:hypothetical protein